MKSLEEVLKTMHRVIEQGMLEMYIERGWVRPQRKKKEWYFEDIDIARLELVCHLSRDIEVNDEGIDVALALLDQLYAMRTHTKHLTYAIRQQPSEVQTEIIKMLRELTLSS